MSQHNSGSGRKRGNMGKGGSRPAPSPAPKAAAAPVEVPAAKAEAAPAVAAAPKAEAAPAAAAVAEKVAPAPEPKAAAAPAETPAKVTPVDAENDAMMERFEHAQKRYGAAYAAMAEGLRGDGVDKLVKYVQYGLAAAAIFVVVAAVVNA